MVNVHLVKTIVRLVMVVIVCLAFLDIIFLQHLAFHAQKINYAKNVIVLVVLFAKKVILLRIKHVHNVANFVHSVLLPLVVLLANQDTLFQQEEVHVLNVY